MTPDGHRDTDDIRRQEEKLLFAVICLFVPGVLALAGLVDPTAVNRSGWLFALALTVAAIVYIFRALPAGHYDTN